MRTFSKRQMNCGRVGVLAAILGAAVAVLFATPAAAGPYDGDDEISSWSPRHFYTIMTNSSSTSDVNYYFRFTDGVDRRGAMRSQAFDPWPDTDVATLEIGFKDTGHQNCRSASNFVQIGIPSASRPQVDNSEDSTDAVLWMSSLNSIKNDQLANPSKDYFAAWKCGATADFRSNPSGEIGPYQVQLGYSLYAPPDPVYTFADRTFNMIPREQAHKAIPSTGDNRNIHMSFDAPWTRDWNFEAARTSQWSTSGSSLTNYCCTYDAYQGGGYMYIAPQNSSNSWMHQQFRIRGYGAEKGQLFLGSNTDYTLNTAFRCPTWSPSSSGKNTSYCTVAVWIKTVNHSSWTGQGYQWNIPNDGKWYPIESTAWGAQTSDDDIQVWVDTRGYHLDVDGLWISSGL